MLLKLGAIPREESSIIRAMSRLERVLGILASAKIRKSRMWNRRLYKHKAASSKN
jgi:hypothetical protein